MGHFKDKWNKNRFSIYDSEEKTVLRMLQNMYNNLSSFAEELDNKTDINGNHLGQWQGLDKPTLSVEGTSATVELLLKSNVIVTVEQFGAKGDGVTDDSLAFNKAMQYLKEQKGGTLFLKNKTYIAHNIELFSNTTITGYYGITTVKRPSRYKTDSETDIFYSVNKSIENIRIENIVIDGNYKNNGHVVNGTKAYEGEINIRASQTNKDQLVKNVTIENVIIINGVQGIVVRGFFEDSKIIKNCQNVYINNCIFKDHYGNPIFTWANSVRITNNVFYNVDDSCIGCDMGQDIVISNNIMHYDVNHNGYKNFNGVMGIAGGFYANMNITVSNNIVNNYTFGIKVTPVTSRTEYSAREVNIVNNQVRYNRTNVSDSLITVEGGKYIKIIGNNIECNNKVTNAIKITKNEPDLESSDILINSNFIKGGIKCGIYLMGIKNVNVTGNTLASCCTSNEYPSASIFGIYLTSGLISANNIYQSTYDSIKVENSTSVLIATNQTNTGVVITTGNTNVKTANNLANNTIV